MRLTRRFGTHPDVPDQRDLVYLPELPSTPRRVDLRDECPPIYDQGSLNACCAHAIAAAIWFEERRKSGAQIPSPSRLFLYFNERVYDRVVPKNVPVSLRNAYKVAARLGVCAETQWPYRIRAYSKRPHARCFAHARLMRISRYYRLHRELKALRTCLAEGHPFAFGISVYPSMRTARVHRTGHIPMPAKRERMLGGHAILAVGYDDAARSLIIRNSWGTGWGHHGYGFLPYDYVLNERMAWDFWTCRPLRR